MSYLWTSIHVKDLEASLKFYQEIVGLPLKVRFPAGPGSEIAFLGDEGTQVELIGHTGGAAAESEAAAVGNGVSLGFAVPSLEEKLAFLAEKGIAPASGIISPGPGTRFFFAADPNGLQIQFVEQK